MTKRMLIDASHAEETRVVVLDGNRLDDFDVETSTKRQLKGNIYLAKVVRVEPSLQAAFVEYGGGRHGFLAFDEIHPDYYQIPVADRQRLIAMQAEDAEREAAEEDRAADAAATDEVPTPVLDAEPAEVEQVDTERADDEPGDDESGDDESGHARRVDAEAADKLEAAAEQPAETPFEAPPRDDPVREEPTAQVSETAAAEPETHEAGEVTNAHRPPAMPAMIVADTLRGPIETDEATEPHAVAHAKTGEPAVEPVPFADVPAFEAHVVEAPVAEAPTAGSEDGLPALSDAEARDVEADTLGDAPVEDLPNGDVEPPPPPPETVGGEADAAEEARERRMPRFLRSYKIQEVIKRRQILLVQVVKEERGTKGAALTTYISLAGRFCVLMPNSPRGGGISRKITSAADRRRLKEITAELEIPRGMGLIVRTAGANRPKPEIRRDCEYLLRLWDDIREHTLRSVAPALIYEEASLIKRAIRDVYSRDVDEILVDGEEGWKAARDFMRMLMPSHAKKVILWRGDGQPLFAKHGVDAQLEAMLQPTVQLKSGGYLVINQTEALVAIDVNSGRSTRERGIEETALRTNLEAAGEVARQLRLRDLAGLVVIDFIDMESKKHNTMVERRMKEALKDDRARIQVGSISHFGLLEMSRQRLRPSLAESSFVICPHCGGLGHVRSTESAAILVLRNIEEEGAKRRAAEIVVHVATSIAMYVLNAKRERLREIEQRYAMRVMFEGDDTLIAPQLRIDRVRAQVPGETVPATLADAAPPPAAPASSGTEEDEADAFDEEDVVAADGEEDGEGEDAAPRSATPETAEDRDRRRRRRRRRSGGRRDDAPPSGEAVRAQPLATVGAAIDTATGGASDDLAVAGEDEDEAEDGGSEEEASEGAETLPGEAARSGEDATQRPRRRGRRGGRRRRREPADHALPAVAALGAEQPELPISSGGISPYSGPTPADPFGGGGFDIFDVMDQVERAAEQDGGRTPEPAAEHAIVTQSVVHQDEPVHAVPTETLLAETVPVPIVEAPIPEVPIPEASVSGAPVPEVSVPESLVPEAAPEPAMAVPANDEVAEPAIRPIVIGSAEAPPVEKKRGWWRR